MQQLDKPDLSGKKDRPKVRALCSRKDRALGTGSERRRVTHPSKEKRVDSGHRVSLEYSPCLWRDGLILRVQVAKLKHFSKVTPSDPVKGTTGQRDDHLISQVLTEMPKVVTMLRERGEQRAITFLLVPEAEAVFAMDLKQVKRATQDAKLVIAPLAHSDKIQQDGWRERYLEHVEAMGHADAQTYLTLNRRLLQEVPEADHPLLSALQEEKFTGIMCLGELFNRDKSLPPEAQAFLRIAGEHQLPVGFTAIENKETLTELADYLEQNDLPGVSWVAGKIANYSLGEAFSLDDLKRSVRMGARQVTGSCTEERSTALEL